jgi:ribosomal protein S18 acetylase RimI-like enzyme
LREACGKLHDVFVARHARRCGIGRALTKEAIARLRDLGVPRVVLTSAWQNQDAHALFRSLGFRATMIEMAKEVASD